MKANYFLLGLGGFVALGIFLTDCREVGNYSLAAAGGSKTCTAVKNSCKLETASLSDAPAAEKNYHKKSRKKKRHGHVWLRFIEQENKTSTSHEYFTEKIQEMKNLFGQTPP